MRGLRGGMFDLFGYTEERRMERALIDEYRETVATLMDALSAETHSLAIDIANTPDMVRGFGHVKLRNVKKAREEQTRLLEQLSSLEGAETAPPMQAAGDD